MYPPPYLLQLQISHSSIPPSQQYQSHIGLAVPMFNQEMIQFTVSRDEYVIERELKEYEDLRIKSRTDISQKDEKPSKKRQNRTRDGKVCEDEA
ncbi:hypothetical protein Tco_1534365, partial [Tanacetum coccineum]